MLGLLLGRSMSSFSSSARTSTGATSEATGWRRRWRGGIVPTATAARARTALAGGGSAARCVPGVGEEGLHPEGSVAAGRD